MYTDKAPDSSHYREYARARARACACGRQIEIRGERFTYKLRCTMKKYERMLMCARVYARVYRYKLFINDRLDDRYFRV